MFVKNVTLLAHVTIAVIVKVEQTICLADPFGSGYMLVSNILPLHIIFTTLTKSIK